MRSQILDSVEGVCAHVEEIKEMIRACVKSELNADGVLL